MGKRRGLFLVVGVMACAGVAAPALAVTSTDRKQNKAIKALKADAEELSAVLTQLDGLFTGYVNSTEYGVVQLYFDPEGNGFEADDAVPGQMLTSADIPDSANQLTASGTMIVPVPDGTTAKPIALKAGIRSGESDGTGAADPVGQASLMAMSARIVGAPGTTSVGGGNPGSTQLPLTSSPNGALAGLPFYDIPTKASLGPPNPTVAPDAQMIELTNPPTLQTLTGPPSRFTVTNTSGAPAAAISEVTVRFVDLSTSTTDLEE